MYDLIVIGAGPGGYEAAIEAAELGKKVAIIERDRLGGTCLNRGCIPTKSLLHSTQLYKECTEATVFGVQADGVSYDLDAMFRRKDEVVTQLVNGVQMLMKKNKIDVFLGTGTLIGKDADGAYSVLVNPITENVDSAKADVIAENSKTNSASSAENSITQSDSFSTENKETSAQTITAQHILIATGSVVSIPPIKGAELADTSDTLLASPKSFSHLVIVGGGVIGMEFASVYMNLGVQVTIIEFLPRILANMDKEFSQSLKMLMKKRGAEIHTDAQMQEITKAADGTYTCVYKEKDTEQTVTCDGVLICTGRRSNICDLFKTTQTAEASDAESFEKNTAGHLNDKSGALESQSKSLSLTQSEQAAAALGIKLERGHIVTDDKGKTGAEGVYAIGDCAGRIMLAHAASAYGRNAVRDMFGAERAQDDNLIPSCVYTNPEIASVGLTLDEAKEQGLSAETKKYPMSANGKSLVSNEERGFIKAVFETETKKLIGAQMMCARASDMIATFAVAIENGLTLQDLSKTVFAHPTYSEGIYETVKLS